MDRCWRWCPFCWIEERHKAKVKRRADFLADKIIAGEWR